MKNVVWIFLFLISSTCFAEQLQNFDQVKAAVSEGKVIRIYIDYTRCSTPDNQQVTTNFIPNSAGIFTPNAMAINVAGNISSYILYFTMRDGKYPGRPVYQYGRYLISQDNTVSLSFSVLNAADYSTIAEVPAIICQINEGAKIFTRG